MFVVNFTRIVLLYLLLPVYIYSGCLEELNKVNLHLLTLTNTINHKQAHELHKTSIDRQIYEKDIYKIISQNISFLIKNNISLKDYNEEEILNILSILGRTKTNTKSMFIYYLLNKQKKDILKFIETYKLVFFNKIKEISAQKPDIENLISLKQGKKFNNNIESQIYLYELYNIIKKNLKESLNVEDFIKQIGLDMQNVMEKNIFIGLDRKDGKRSLIGKIKENTSSIALEVYNSHLDKYNNRFLEHSQKNNPYKFNIMFIDNKIILQDINYGNKSYNLENGRTKQNIEALSKTSPIFKELLAYDIDLAENSNILLDNFRKNSNLKKSTPVYLQITSDIEHINGKEIISTSILDFYFKDIYENDIIDTEKELQNKQLSNHRASLVYISSINVKKIIKELSADFKKAQILYKKTNLSAKEKEQLVQLSIEFSYYLSKFVPYYRGSSGVARTFSAILLEKAFGKLPDLKEILFDLDAFTNTFPHYKTLFYEYPFMKEK